VEFVGGRGVKLAPGSGVSQAELFLAIDVDAGQAETQVRQASAVERSWLDSDRLRESIDVEFDETAFRVVAWKRTRFDDLVIEEKAANATNDATARLNRVPAGFMRDMTREEVEKVAAAAGVTTIDLAVCEDGIGHARETMNEVIAGYVSNKKPR
jgi:hypothetical protein